MRGRLWPALGLVCLGALAAGCIWEPWIQVSVKVRVSPEVQASYSNLTRGVVVARLQAGSYEERQVFAVLCEPSVETLKIVNIMGGVACARDGIASAWMAEPDEDEDPPDCATELGPYHGPSWDPPKEAAQASVEIFTDVGPTGCRNGEDAVTLNLAYR